METENLLKDKFELKLKEIISSKKQQHHESVLSVAEYGCILEEVREAKKARKEKKSLSPKEYRRLKRFDIHVLGDSEKLICAKSKPELKYYLNENECFEIIHNTHVNSGHKRERVMEIKLKKKYCNITRDIINCYLQLCSICQVKKKHPRKGLVVKPLLFDEMNSRCQVDLIDMQSAPDEGYKFIMVYQDHLTKFLFLKPLKSKTAEEVSYNLIDVFSVIGAPMILQSDNGREFANRVIEELTTLWPILKIVHGKPRHSQSQGSVERANQDIRDMLIAWQQQNNSQRWSEGLKFVQYQKNTCHHEGIKRTPYRAMFGVDARLGLQDSSLSPDIIPAINSEEDLEAVLNTCNKESEADESRSTLDEVAVSASVNQNDVGTAPDSIEDKMDEHILLERQCAKRALEEQAEKMLKLSNKKFKPALVGETVTVKVPDVDRGRNCPRNVLAVVMETLDGGLYRLGVAEGILEKLYCRNEFLVCKESFLAVDSIPKDTAPTLSLRTAAAKSSGSQQGFIKCNCLGKCDSKRCKCFKLKILCNSKCHHSTSCRNK